MSDADLNKERLELALEAAGLDLWENNLLTGEVTRKASKTFEELGFTEEEIELLERKWAHFLRQDVEVILFNEDFFAAAVPELKELADVLHIKVRR